MSELPVSMQSTPNVAEFSVPWRAFNSDRVSIGDRPLFSASASGIDSSATLNERNAYCSSVDTNLGRTTTVNDARVTDQRTHDAQRVVDRSFRFRRHHFVATADQHGHGARVLAVFDHQHLVLGRTEAKLAHHTRRTELIGRKFLETWHNTATGSDRNQLNLGSTNPTDGRQLLLQQQMVRLIIEAPLTDGKRGARILHLLHHLQELLLLVFAQLAARVLHPAAHLTLQLDQLEVDVLLFEIGHRQHRVHRNFRHLPVTLVHDLAAERGHRHLDQWFLVLSRHRERVGDRVQMLHGTLGRQLEPIGNTDRVDATVEQRFGLLEQSTGQHHHSGRTIADLIVLRLAELHHQFADFVIHIHLLHDRCTVVRDRDVTVAADHHLVQTLRSERRPDDGGDLLRCLNVTLLFVCFAGSRFRNVFATAAVTAVAAVVRRFRSPMAVGKTVNRSKFSMTQARPTIVIDRKVEKRRTTAGRTMRNTATSVAAAAAAPDPTAERVEDGGLWAFGWARGRQSSTEQRQQPQHHRHRRCRRQQLWSMLSATTILLLLLLLPSHNDRSFAKDKTL
uniref:Uncharacterized protein n=1 Tax=Anopheles farauti TaxID=69004 RepID=A0A182Q4N6_9DIPT